ncbi:hypothetical protein [Streptomyces boninensis]|uniref:hypothetical protein n=1 Tax=Streptomyces boninensis TaxID=2039455 RepID=UPI003B2277EE
MRQIKPSDFSGIRDAARAYCRAIDSTRSRKRMNGSATVAISGRALYGTDDVSDDVTQDAVLLFAKRLHEISTTCEVAAVRVATREPSAWQYVRRDGDVIVVSRETLRYWAVRDAAARNGYRRDARTNLTDDMLSILAVAPHLAESAEAIFRTAWAGGDEYPILRRALLIAGQADDLGRAGIFGQIAVELYGGPRNSSSKVQRTRDAAIKEWRSLRAALDEARAELVPRGIEPFPTSH